MYCELFKLEEPPFRLTPDPQFLYASKQHARAKAYMESSIWLADGFVVITGEIGSGKTTLIECFLAELPENVVLAHINQTQLTPEEFLQALLLEFGFKPFGKSKVELLSVLKDFMIEQYAAGKTLLLIIDEAQNLSYEVLEELRMLSGIESQKEKLLRIILAGQPELSRQLNDRKLEQLKQRVRLQFNLGALSKRETREYIEHRLEIAGAKGRRIFEDSAFDSIFTYTGGVPRLINTLCDSAMLCAFAEEQDVITGETLSLAVEELQWSPFAERYGDTPPDTASAPDNTAAGEAQARFDVLFRDEWISQYDLPVGQTVIGRTPDNDLQIDSKFVSRHHAKVSTESDACTLEDLNSTNGVFVGSSKVARHQLADGDLIKLGEHSLVYHDLRSRTERLETLGEEPSEAGVDDRTRQTASGADADS